jgi:hypothetical protein
MADIIAGAQKLFITEVKPLDDYKLLLKFSNDEYRIFDVTPLLEKPVYRPLKDKVLFDKVHIICGYTIAWNEDLDMCPDSLYLDSVPV